MRTSTFRNLNATAQRSSSIAATSSRVRTVIASNSGSAMLCIGHTKAFPPCGCAGGSTGVPTGFSPSAGPPTLEVLLNGPEDLRVPRALAPEDRPVGVRRPFREAHLLPAPLTAHGPGHKARPYRPFAKAKGVDIDPEE